MRSALTVGVIWMCFGGGMIVGALGIRPNVYWSGGALLIGGALAILSAGFYEFGRRHG